MSDEHGPPAKKRPKTRSSTTTRSGLATQSSLHSFFGSQNSSKKKDVKKGLFAAKANGDKGYNDDDDGHNDDERKQAPKRAKTENGTSAKNDDDKNGKNEANEVNKTTSTVPDPISPSVVTPRNAVWTSLHDNHVLVRKPTNDKKPRTKVAAFDLDGTLMVWSASFTGFWPNQLSHFELWSSTVPNKLRDLYDDGYKIVFISNQGGIQKAHTGKKATLIKNVMNWLAHMIDRPVHAVLSTRSLKKTSDSFHKPTPKMWQVVVESLNNRTLFDLSSSFFVGDSSDPNDEQGGVDLKFAENVGSRFNKDKTPLKFYTPTEYFGPSDAARRQKTQQLGNEPPIPDEALATRSALLGGYLTGPVLLILCGVQGSGKSTFCEKLLEGKGDDHWVHLSQDTINNGKPGKREKVELEAKLALQGGHSTVVDRMHLDPEQRDYFVQVAKDVGVPVHILLLNPDRDIVAKRVRERTNHPGKVQGEDGARRALQSLDKLVVPTYAEEVQLITCVKTGEEAIRYAGLYRALAPGCEIPPVSMKVKLDKDVSIPRIALGTMGVGKRITKDVIESAVKVGIRAIDTAPTYKNEDRIGDALTDLREDIFCIAKVPKVAAQPDDVRTQLKASLSKLKKGHVDLLLLHWPCDVMNNGTLEDVWKTMEECRAEGLCKALGVCNFNARALSSLLCVCSHPPVINQVERHPLCSQMELVDFCARNNILLQAHTPLGQGKDELLQNSVIRQIAKKSHMSPAQVILQWNIQQGFLIVPKCSSIEHMEEVVMKKKNSTRQSLSSDDMKQIDMLNEGKRFVTPPFMYGKADYCWGGSLRGLSRK